MLYICCICVLSIILYIIFKMTTTSKKYNFSFVDYFKNQCIEEFYNFNDDFHKYDFTNDKYANKLYNIKKNISFKIRDIINEYLHMNSVEEIEFYKQYEIPFLCAIDEYDYIIASEKLTELDKYLNTTINGI